MRTRTGRGRLAMVLLMALVPSSGRAGFSTSTPAPPTSTPGVPDAFAIDNIVTFTLDSRDPLEIVAGRRAEELCILAIFAAAPGPGNVAESFLYDLGTDTVTDTGSLPLPSASTFSLAHSMPLTLNFEWITTLNSGFNPYAARSDDCVNWELFALGGGDEWGTTEIAVLPDATLLAGAYNFDDNFYNVQNSTDGETWNPYTTIAGPNGRPLVDAINQGVRPCITDELFFGAEANPGGTSFSHFVRPLLSTTPVQFFDTDVLGSTLAESICTPGGWAYARRSGNIVRYRPPITTGLGVTTVNGAPVLGGGQFYGVCMIDLQGDLAFVAYPQDHIAVIDWSNSASPLVLDVDGDLPGQKGPAACLDLGAPLSGPTVTSTLTPTPGGDGNGGGGNGGGFVRKLIYLGEGGSTTLTRLDLVAGDLPPVQEIPTISGWGIAALIGLLAALQYLTLRRRPPAPSQEP